MRTCHHQSADGGFATRRVVRCSHAHIWPAIWLQHATTTSRPSRPTACPGAAGRLGLSPSHPGTHSQITRRVQAEVASPVQTEIRTFEGAPHASPHTSSQPLSWTARWWPVMQLEGTNTKIPQHVDLLGKSLVVWADSQGQWHCLEDKCPHRLAPLSEGRVEGDTLMCSYHGWTFKSSGACTNIPQLNHDPKAQAAACSSKRSCAKAYPTSSALGLLWVWPEAGEAAAAQAAATQAGSDMGATIFPWFIRHVPIRFDTLMENVMDPSHVAYAHHGIQGNRYKPYNVWSEAVSGPVQPTGFVTSATEGRELHFIAPCVARYKYSNFFGLQTMVVPTKPGWSKLYASFGINPNQPGRPLFTRVLPKDLVVVMLHLTQSNPVIDGDTYMLHVAEREMSVRNGVGVEWTRQCYMPAATDNAVTGMRKWITQFAGDVPTCTPADAPLMPPLMTKEQVLDRYTQHTKDCVYCSRTLALLDKVRTFIAAAGLLVAASAVVAAAAALSQAAAGAVAPPALVLGSVSATAAQLQVLAGAVIGALALKVYEWLGRLRQKFFYEEYVHATRD